MRKVFLSLAIIVFSLIGIVDAGYITYEKFLGQIPPCQTAFKCETVLTSKWANIGPIPLSVLGIVFYSAMLLLGIANYLELPELKLGKKKIEVVHLLALLGVFGFLFSMYLVFLMGVILHAWCLYCLISAANCVILFITTQLLQKTCKGIYGVYI
jgi:uncharacterized membrane protein